MVNIQHLTRSHVKHALEVNIAGQQLPLMVQRAFNRVVRLDIFANRDLTLLSLKRWTLLQVS
jgi:hypothetical protein